MCMIPPPLPKLIAELIQLQDTTTSCHTLADLQCTKMGPLFGLWVDIILLWKASMGVA